MKSREPETQSIPSRSIPQVPLFESPLTPLPGEDNDIQLGSPIESFKASQLKRQLLQGYTPTERVPSNTVSDGYPQCGSSIWGDTAGRSSGSLPLGVGLKDYDPNSEIYKFADTDMFEKALSQRIISEPVYQNQAVWQNSEHDYHVLPPKQAVPEEPLISLSPGPSSDSIHPPHSTMTSEDYGLLDVDLFLTSFEDAAPSVEGNSLLHLGASWFSEDLAVEAAKSDLNTMFPPLRTQLVQSWPTEESDEFDEFDDPMPLQVDSNLLN